MGLTPLYLALRLGMRESTIVCGDNGCDPLAKSAPYTYSPLEYIV